MNDEEQLENSEMEEQTIEGGSEVQQEEATKEQLSTPETNETDLPASPTPQADNTGFEPKIIGFLCNWCSYAGADLCGVSRYQYPTNIRIIRVMCSTRLDPSIIMEMLIQGADGVLVGGCHPGDCHYIKGNFYTERKINLTKKLLNEAGFDTNRLKLEWISASEGERFSNVIKEFTNKIKELGPSPIAGDNPDIDRLEAIFAARNAACDFRLRALVGREINLTTDGNVYEEVLSQDRLDELYESILKDEFLRHRILQLTKNRPLSVKDLAKYVNFTPETILKQIVTLKDRGLILVDRIDGTSPLYVSGQEQPGEPEGEPQKEVIT
jgi:coenzyme F420-reducing hydrogenase delta subunit